MTEAEILELLLQLLRQRRRAAGRRTVGVVGSGGTVVIAAAIIVAIGRRRRGGGVVGSSSVAVAVVDSKVFDWAFGSMGRDKGGALRDGRASGDLNLVLVGDLFNNLCDLAAVGENGDNPLLVHDGFADLLRLRHCCSFWLMSDGG